MAYGRRRHDVKILPGLITTIGSTRAEADRRFDEQNALLPPGQQATDQLLAVFELEKAVYELRYELNNRPDWVAIPVAGILRLIDSSH